MWDHRTRIASTEGPVGLDGLTALSQMAGQAGVPLSGGQARRLWSGEAIDDVATFLGAARKLGMSALAMEGPYEELSSLELPAVVVLAGRSAEQVAFAVLHEVDGTRAVVSDASGGRIPLDRDAFCARWTGDVIALSRDDEAVAQALEELRRRTRPAPWVAWGGVGLLVAALVAGGSAGVLGPARTAVGWAAQAAVGAALLGALASALLRGGCVTCHRAAALVGGLPLGWVGVAAYGALFAGMLLRPGSPLVAAGLVAAAGGHVVLVRLLWRHALACLPCLATAAAVLGGAALALSDGRLSPLPAVGLILGGALATWAGVRGARRLLQLRLSENALRVGREVLAEGEAEAVGATPGSARGAAGGLRTRLVVYRKLGCTPCAIFESAYAPSLEGVFGDALEIEWRDAGRRLIATPLMVIRGELPVLLTGLPGGDDPFGALCGLVELSRAGCGGGGGTPAAGLFVAG